ncbi:UNVERIFIED_CONTAM: hypothetical protein H355_004209 [Colinus virginianus]|nr:hypothetical protein H355_004209 [Colinus virginianus]
MSERLGKPTCLLIASSAAAGVSAQSFLQCFTLSSSAFNLQVATPGGKSIDFVDVNESNMRWIQDFRMKSYANPAKLESIDGKVSAAGLCHLLLSERQVLVTPLEMKGIQKRHESCCLKSKP